MLQKIPGRTVIGRLVEDGAEALLGMVEPAGDQIPHRSLMQIAHQERGGIDIALSPQQLVQLQRLQPSGNRHPVEVAPLEVIPGGLPHLARRQYGGPIGLVQHLQPACQVHRVPDHRVRQAPRRPDVADQDLSRRQTDARLERRRIVRRLVEPLKGTLGRQSRFAGLGGMIADGGAAH